MHCQLYMNNWIFINNIDKVWKSVSTTEWKIILTISQFKIFLEFMADNSDFFLVIRCIYLNSVFYLFIFLFAIVSIQKLAFFLTILSLTILTYFRNSDNYDFFS